jgi:hypothetical protein
LADMTPTIPANWAQKNAAPEGHRVRGG